MAKPSTPRRRMSRLRIWFNLCAVAAIAGFCAMNRAPVPAWPLPEPAPLFAHGLIGLTLGFAWGWLSRNAMARRRRAEAAVGVE